MTLIRVIFFFFFFNDTATTEIYTLSLHDALPISKDGVSVAKEIELKDKFENMGAQMVKEVASNTSDEAGDGTTTATVLAQAIIREGLKSVAAGANPMDLKRGIDLAVSAATEELKKLSKPCKDP